MVTKGTYMYHEIFSLTKKARSGAPGTLHRSTRTSYTAFIFLECLLSYGEYLICFDFNSNMTAVYGLLIWARSPNQQLHEVMLNVS